MKRFEHTQPNPNRITATATLVALGISASALAGCTTSAQERFGEPLEGTQTIIIEPGANIRENPYVGSSPEDDTLLVKTPEELQIITDGVYLEVNENGEWYGLPVNATGLDIEDGDGVIWVNEQTSVRHN